ncbi:hypothetical protein HANVADRAFT_2830 [Hanseniaspora valbyensis NRRL Y-1626]|uniref:DNA replication checkpoint mediator MRC1 domain-containing protein n=1 Tax=Hanseniaspora valbyensis NRRL Y-1626 TaxID=766949 RepID=A0A1B7TCH0_9ASCO|nr:hypothetical protein HANVADRAFT_2830 [Hanseniaspora valbyensis NRRL Y-1626]
MGLFDFLKEKNETGKNEEVNDNNESINQSDTLESDMFLFDSDDESVNDQEKFRPKKKRRDDSLLTKLRYRFGTNKGLGDEDEEEEEKEEQSITQPTQLKANISDIEENAPNSSNFTQPTQLKPISEVVSTTQPTQLKPTSAIISATQPTQLKNVSIFYQEGEEEEQVDSNQTQPTQLKTMTTQITQIKTTITQPTQMKSIFDEEEEEGDDDDDDFLPVKTKTTQPTQMRPIFDEDEEEDDDFLPSKTKATQLKPVFSDDDDDEEDVILSKKTTQSKDENLFSSGDDIDNNKKESGKKTLDSEVITKEKDFLSDDSFNSDVSDFEIDLKPIEESIFKKPTHNNSHVVSVGTAIEQTETTEFETKLISKPNSIKKTITFSSSDDDEEDYDGNISAEKGDTKATTLAIKAHFAQQKYLSKIQLNGGANKLKLQKSSNGLDTDGLVEKLRREAAKQSRGSRVDLTGVDKLYEEVVLNNDNNKMDNNVAEIEGEDDEDEKEFDGDSDLELESSDISDLEEINENNDISEVIDNNADVVVVAAAAENTEAVVEEIVYGKRKNDILKTTIKSELKKKETIETASNESFISDVEEAEEIEIKSLNVSDSDDNNNDHTSEISIENPQKKEKNLTIKSIENKPEKFNPFVAQEAEESDSDEERLGISKNKTLNKEGEEEYVDNEVHTSDEEMMDDNSDVEDNEELLRDLNREQRANDEEVLEKQIQDTLKGKKRGDRDEFGVADDYDDYDLEEDEEYLAYKKRQIMIDAQVAKRMNKSSKNKMNVLEGLNTRIVLPESKIDVLDKMTISSTLSFLGSTVEEEMKEQKQERIQEQIEKVGTIDQVSISEIKERLQKKEVEENVDNENDSNVLESDDSDSDSDSGYNTLSFFKKANNFIKKKPAENENMKFRIGAKTYTKNYVKTNNMVKSAAERVAVNNKSFANSQQTKKEVPFLGNKRKLEYKPKGFNKDFKRHKYSQNSFKKKNQK